MELHPEVQIKVLYQRDYLHLLVKYGLEPPSQLADGTGAATLDLFPDPRRGAARPPRARERQHRVASPACTRSLTQPVTGERDMTLRHCPLDAEHRALGARMVPFGGWDMPIQYTSVLEEHRACREHAVVFDVSHLGSVRVHGAGAFATLQWAFTNDLDRIAPGQGAVHAPARPRRRARRRRHHRVVGRAGDFLVMPNASNTAPLVDALGEAAVFHGGGECAIDDITADRVVLAVQGPEARARLATIAPEHAAVARFAVEPRRLRRALPGWVAGTGYTGEDGVELHVPGGGRGRVLARAARRRGSRPRASAPATRCGSRPGSRCTVTSSGPASRRCRPASAGWCASTRATSAAGAPLEAERDRGVARRLRGLSSTAARSRARATRCRATAPRSARSRAATSRRCSSTAIALAFLPPDVADGDTVTIDVRGRAVPAIVTKLPFVRR